MFPVGTIIPYAGDLSKIPYGWHVCDGTNGTPDLSSRFLEGTTTTPKTFKEAGLPNITGDINGDQGNRTEEYTKPFTVADTFRTSGALSMYDIVASNRGYEIANSINAYVTFGMHFDASKSNSIYGASDTVQPKSYTVYYIMRIK